jgi:hypothetical protein
MAGEGYAVNREPKAPPAGAVRLGLAILVTVVAVNARRWSGPGGSVLRLSPRGGATNLNSNEGGAW